MSMTNATTTRRPLTFTTRPEAEAWLKATNNYGAVVEGSHGLIVIQPDVVGVWAFTAPDELALLPEW